MHPKRPGHQDPAPGPAPSTGGGTRPARNGRCARDGSRSCRGGRPAPVPAPAASPPQSAPPGRPYWHAEQTHAFPVIFRYLHAPHRPGEVTPRAHPVPQPEEIVPQLLLEQADADRVHARRPVIGPDLLPRLHDEALTDLKRLHLRLGPGPRLLPLRVGPRLTLVCTAPWLRPHYRTLLATMSRPAPVPRLGTLPLAVSAARGPPSRGQRGSLAPLTWPPISGRQVLLFHASAHDELTPPLHRAPPGQHAGHPLAEGTPARRAFVPGTLYLPGFGAIAPPGGTSCRLACRAAWARARRRRCVGRRRWPPRLWRPQGPRRRHSRRRRPPAGR